MSVCLAQHTIVGTLVEIKLALHNTKFFCSRDGIMNTRRRRCLRYINALNCVMKKQHAYEHVHINTLRTPHLRMILAHDEMLLIFGQNPFHTSAARDNRGLEE